MRTVRIFLCATVAALTSVLGGCTSSPVESAERAASATVVAKMNAGASTGALLADSVQATQGDLVQPCSDREPAEEQDCRGGGMIGGH